MESTLLHEPPGGRRCRVTWRPSSGLPARLAYVAVSATLSVAAVARRLKIPVVAICGIQGDGVKAVQRIGIDAYFSTLTHPVAEADVPRYGPRQLTDVAEQLGRFLVVAQGLGKKR